MDTKEYKEYNKEKDKQQANRLSSLRSYTAALLMLIPSINIQSGIVSILEEQSTYKEYYTPHENNEIVAYYEIIFKDGVRRALDGINTIDQIPPGGKKITYYRHSGNSKGQPMSPESVKTFNLPDKFDISPRVVGKDPISSIYFTLGNRVFSITPDVGSISDISLNPKELVIEISMLFDIINEKIIYDKQDKLPDLMYRLWTTPRGKGEKKGFKATTVKEL